MPSLKFNLKNKSLVLNLVFFIDISNITCSKYVSPEFVLTQSLAKTLFWKNTKHLLKFSDANIFALKKITMSVGAKSLLQRTAWTSKKLQIMECHAIKLYKAVIYV